MLLRDEEFKKRLNELEQRQTLLREEILATLESRISVIEAKNEILRSTAERMKEDKEVLLGEIHDLEADLKSQKMTEISAKGVNARKEYAERLEAAMARAIQLFQQGTPHEEILRVVGTEYPDVASRLLKKQLGF